jgi:hypothetical protein
VKLTVTKEARERPVWPNDDRPSVSGVPGTLLGSSSGVCCRAGFPLVLQSVVRMRHEREG